MIVFSNQLRGTFLVAFSGVLYGLLGYLGTRLIDENFSIENMLFWRFFVAMLWMLGTLLIKKISFQDISPHSSLIKIIFFAAITYSGSSIFYFLATQEIGTGVAMVIFFSYPMFVAIFAWALTNWEINKLAILSLIMVLIGLIFLKGHGKNTLNLIGVFYALVGSLFYAVYVYGSQNMTRAIDSTRLTMLICLANTLIFLTMACYTNSLSLPHTLTAWICVVAIGIITTALPIQLLLDGLKYISPIKASILSVLEPVVTVIVGLLLLNETISPAQSLGVMIVLLAAVLIQFEKTSDIY